MEKNKIIIPDTNFIIENNKNFSEILKTLSKFADVYISKITIEERLAQTRIKLKEDYDEIQKLSNKHKELIDISIKQNLEEKIKQKEDAILNSYKKVIGENIIPFPKDEKIFSIVLERVYNKIPPFSRNENASDKGFKDTLLWLSLLEFFKDYGKDKEIILITNDKGFIKGNADALKQEFLEKTNKEIQIQNNDYYNKLIDNNEITKSEKKTIQKELTSLELNELREEIKRTISNICLALIDGGYECYSKPAFERNFDFDTDILKKCLENMDNILIENIFEKDISASVFFKNLISRDFYKIEIESFETLNNLYKKMKTSYTEYLNQFLKVTCNIINEQTPYSSELPF